MYLLFLLKKFNERKISFTIIIDVEVDVKESITSILYLCTKLVSILLLINLREN